MCSIYELVEGDGPSDVESVDAKWGSVVETYAMQCNVNG